MGLAVVLLRRANRRRGLPFSCIKTICCALGFVVLMGKVLVLHWPRPALTLVHCPVSSLSTPGLYQAIWVPGAWTGLSHYSSVSWDRTVGWMVDGFGVVWFLFPVAHSGGVIPFLFACHLRKWKNLGFSAYLSLIYTYPGVSSLMQHYFSSFLQGLTLKETSSQDKP